MRSEVLALIAAVAGGMGATAAVAVAGASPPARPAGAVAGAARVQGHFTAVGRATAAEHVSGVHRGEHFHRTWTLTSEGCRASSCAQLRLVGRLGVGANETDRVTLSRVSPGRYRWLHRASSDALCRTRHVNGVYRAASALDVIVRQRVEVNRVWYATALTATWSASSGGCGASAERSAVTYAATVTSGVPAAALPTGTTTSGSTTTGSVTSTDPMVTFPSSTGTTPTVTTISSTPSPTTPTSTNPHAPQPEAGG